MTIEEVLKLMRKRQNGRDGKQFAAELGISAAYLSDIYHRRRELGPSVLQALGLEREIVYRQAA